MKRNIYLVVILCLSVASLSFGQGTAKIPHGRMVNFNYAESKIFPGTQRQVDIYIPDQIDATKPACLYVQQDGFDANSGFNLILDTLIANKEIPVTVGIFIKSGNVNPPNSKTIQRPNRGFEYDGVGNNYVRFLTEEIIPYVKAKYNLTLSNSGNDHCIAGASSGGISAFNTAWQRPDIFSRVYCSSGSFVSFRGGNEFPTLVRKTEPKPLRLFMTAGTYDMENCAGDWTLINEEMDKALKFSGYDYQFHLLDGGHVTGYREHFAAAMRYLWKGWPELVKAGRGAPRVNDIILPGESWQLVKSGFNHVYGPACNKNGEVFFANPGDDKIHRIGTDGKITVFASNTGHCNSLSFGAGGELYAASKITGKIMRYDVNGKPALYAQNIKAGYILARPNGGLYATTEATAGTPSKIYLIKDGKKTVVDVGLKSASGIAMAPDQWLLAVADHDSHWVYSYTIADDGNLQNKERLFWLSVQDWDDDSGAESVCYDKEGHMYAATRSGVQVCTHDGPLQVILPSPGERITGLCFGGKDMDLLFAFCGDKIYQRKVKTHGIGAFTPWMSMTPGKL